MSKREIDYRLKSATAHLPAMHRIVSAYRERLEEIEADRLATPREKAADRDAALKKTKALVEAEYKAANRETWPVQKSVERFESLIATELQSSDPARQARFDRAARWIDSRLAAGAGYADLFGEARTFDEWLVVMAEHPRRIEAAAGHDAKAKPTQSAIAEVTRVGWDRLEEIPDAGDDVKEAVATGRGYRAVEAAFLEARAVIDLELDGTISGPLLSERRMAAGILIDTVLGPGTELAAIAQPAPEPREPDPIRTGPVLPSPNQSAPAGGPPRRSVQRGPARVVGSVITRR